MFIFILNHFHLYEGFCTGGLIWCSSCLWKIKQEIKTRKIFWLKRSNIFWQDDEMLGWFTESKKRERTHIKCLLISRHFTYIISLNPPRMRWELFTHNNNLKPSELITYSKSSTIFVYQLCSVTYWSALMCCLLPDLGLMQRKIQENFWSSCTKDNK